MPRGLGDIPELRLEVLQGFVTKFTMPPELLLMNLFSAKQSPSSTIKWESQTGSRGMTPFVPPGAPAPQTSPHGIAKHSAEAAYWKEKMYFDEEFLNNIRKEGTEQQHLGAQQRLARELAGLVNRSNRRKEWMFAKMLTDGEITYSARSGVKLAVDYDVPTAHSVALTTNYKWENGTERDILGDIITGKRQVADDCGGKIKYALCTSQVLQYVAQDPAILTLLQKSTFGNGDLFSGSKHGIVGVNPTVLGSLLDIENLVIYDEIYEARSWLTAAVTADSTVAISVDDVSDFEVGGTLRFHDVSAGTYEDETISAVGTEAGTVTVSTAPSTSYRAGEDYVSMKKKFIPDDKFVMFADKVEGQDIAEYFEAPYGLGRKYGIQTDTHPEWDPEGIFIRVQDKGLPVLIQRDAVYTIDVN